MFDYDVSEDAGKSRVTDIDNGNTITATSSDPHGFWTLKLGKGALPEEYHGHYTTYEEADKAIKKYLFNRGRAIADVNAEPRPVLQVKPGFDKKA
jgi:hypothetical protein